MTDKQIDAMKHLPLWKSLAAMAPTLEYDTVDIMERYPGIDAHGVGVPTLVMFGASSPAFMAQTARELARTLPGAKLRSLEGQSHDVSPAPLAAELEVFFA